jgi:hypothetical protein
MTLSIRGDTHNVVRSKTDDIQTFYCFRLKNVFYLFSVIRVLNHRSCGKRNPLYPIRAASFVSIVLYPIHKREDVSSSSTCTFPLLTAGITASISDIRGRIYNSFAGGNIVQVLIFVYCSLVTSNRKAVSLLFTTNNRLVDLS